MDFFKFMNVIVFLDGEDIVIVFVLIVIVNVKCFVIYKI